MKDFDREREAGVAKRELTFKAGGEEFRVLAFVPPEHLDSFHPSQRKEGETVLNKYDDWIKSMLVEEDRPKWDKVRAEADPPMALHDVEQVVFWLVEVATGRPTERPSRLASGQQAPAGGSEATSPSRKVTPVPT